ncbi:U-scoloptoxin(01)-Er1a-like [Macrobrachium rosenbergii]|uniref:U-scoloptoxin(01)-Er1a-like n=1 Tax=Macrobrachium rosenbergii TaxID=79674 RepID=UPI0034D48511
MRSVYLASVILTAGLAVTLGQQQVLPFLDAVPRTLFSCVDRPYGYYADVEANCQVFHICLNNAQWDFLCPNQTQFNQEYFVCDHPVNVDCDLSESLYSLNSNFGKTQVEEDDGTESPVLGIEEAV